MACERLDGSNCRGGAYADRLALLRASDAVVKFVSFEPLLDSISDPDLDGIDWAIVGGESGPGARAIELQWVLDIRDACVRKSVPFFQAVGRCTQD